MKVKNILVSYINLRIKLLFSILLFLNWIKSTSRYSIIINNYLLFMVKDHELIYYSIQNFLKFFQTKILLKSFNYKFKYINKCFGKVYYYNYFNIK